MIFQNSIRNTAIFYTCGTCNLRCEYCGIHKSPVLKEIDDILAKSFEGDYYFNRVKEYFPRKDMLTCFETWGGEPFLHMERLVPTLYKLIEYYPYLSSGFSSTNFSYDAWTDKFFLLMDVFGAYPYRDFNYCLQLSVDGPEEINDMGRGQGVTERCLKNFKKLIDLLSSERLPKNVNLFISLKPTLDNKTIRLLDSKEKIIEYYQFLENNFIIPVKELNNPKIDINNAVPNTAVPSPVTADDGRYFSNLVKNCLEIEAENEEQHCFKYYSYITPYGRGAEQNVMTYRYGYNNCGSGNTNVGFLPNGLVSTCHEGFTQIVEKYTELAQKDPRELSSITFDKFLSEQAVSLSGNDENYCTHCYKMSLYNKDNTTARLVSDTALIIALAMSGAIDRKYIDEKQAQEAAIFMQSRTAYCIKDNYNKTGSYCLQPVGLFVLLLNGAMEHIKNHKRG